MPSAHGFAVDSFFPFVSALAFLSGSCFGFFFAGRQHRLW
jgi:hypothetical protein